MSTRNVVLYDKDGNQIAPATTATQAKYNSNVTVKSKIDELSDRIDNISPGANIQSLTVTANGTYNVSSGVDGFNPVTVNVPSVTPEPEYGLIRHFDFTQSEYDLITGTKAVLNNVTRDSNGAHFANDTNNKYIDTKINFGYDPDYPNAEYKLELEFGEFNEQYIYDWTCLFSLLMEEYWVFYLLRRNSSNASFQNQNAGTREWTGTVINQATLNELMTNNTLTFEFGFTSGNELSWNSYSSANNELDASMSAIPVPRYVMANKKNVSDLYIGRNGTGQNGACYPMTIKSIKVYRTLAS